MVGWYVYSFIRPFLQSVSAYNTWYESVKSSKQAMSSSPDKEDNNSILSREIESWKSSFAYALRAEDREIFFEMLKVYEDYAEAIKSKGELPTESLLIALILEQQKMIKRLTDYEIYDYRFKR
jgi:hypothetical protein